MTAQGFSFSARAKDNAGDREPPDKGRPSFRDMVLGAKESTTPRPKVDLIESKLARIEFEDDNPLKPKVIIDESVFEGLCAPWKDALVVKLLGKSIGYNTMKDRLTRLWKLSAGFEILDIGNDFFMVKFDTEVDRCKVMDGGPWMIFDHYLTVQVWSPNFMSPSAQIEKTMVWIRFPGLNLFFYDESILMALVAVVGKPIKVDSNTLDVRRGRFARVCVEIDLNKPVVGRVWLKGNWYRVEYEGLHRICTMCGCYGHLTRECRKKQPDMQTPSLLNNNDTTAGKNGVATTQQGGDSGQPPANAVSNANNAEPSSSHPIGGAVTENEDPLHGEWLIVKRKQRKKISQKNSKEDNVSKSKPPINHDRKEKGQAKKNNPHAKDSHLNKQVWDPKKIKSDPKKVASTSNTKRQRKEFEPPMWTSQREITDLVNKVQPNSSPSPAQLHPPKNGQANHAGPTIFDLGNGAKSTVNMQAISSSHFTFVHDEETKHVDDNHGAMDDAMFHDTRGNDDQDMVHETQMDDQPMAT